MAAPLPGIRACVFDGYGTLFDYASAAAGCRDVLGERHGPLTTLWRDKQLQYTWLRALQGRHIDFWQVTCDALDFALETLGLDDPPLRARLMDLYRTLDVFAEVPAVLKQLKVAGLKTAILSNGSPDMLDAAVNKAGIGDLLDAVLSVELVGVYKPHPKVYQLAVDRLAIPARDLVPVFQCLGRSCCLGLRHARGVVQPLWPAAGAAAWKTGSRDRLARGAAGKCEGIATEGGR